jgi:hypothetical protein
MTGTLYVVTTVFMLPRNRRLGSRIHAVALHTSAGMQKLPAYHVVLLLGI